MVQNNSLEDSPKRREITILLVDDDEIDREAIIRSFRKAKIANPIVEKKDGLEALQLLQNEGIYSPFIILLDLKMPRMDGLQFLEELRQDKSLKKSVVFVLTTSDSERNRYNSYNLNVAGYIVKKNAGKNFIDLITMLDHYWRVVLLP